MALVTAPSSLSSKTLLHRLSFHPRRSILPLPTAKPISAVHATDPPPLSSSSASAVATTWTLESWKTKDALQLPEYPDPDALEAVFGTLESFPPIVFAGEARSLEERLGQAAMGNAFLLQGGDCAESFKEFNANNIRDTFRVILQMSVVLMFGGQMPVIKVGSKAVIVKGSVVCVELREKKLVSVGLSWPACVVWCLEI